MNRLTSQVINKINKVDDERVIDFIDSVTNDIKTRKIEVTEYLKVILQMLVAQLVLYFKSADEVFKNNALSSTDDYKRKSKAPEIAVMEKSHDKILELLDKIALSPLSSAKVKKLSKDDDLDAKELLDELVG